MANITLGGNPCETLGDVPAVGSTFGDFEITTVGLEDVKLSSFSGTRVLNIFPSVNTDVCATSVRKFNQLATEDENVNVLNISEDLPFALKKFRVNEGIDRSESYSSFRTSFGDDSGMRITNGPFKGLLARAVIVIDAEGKVLHSELVSEIGDEPNYDAALAAL